MRCLYLPFLLMAILDGATAKAPQIRDSKPATRPDSPTRLAFFGSRLRGGASVVSLDPNVEVNTANMAMALQWTTDLNRRLQETALASVTLEPRSSQSGFASGRSTIPRGGGTGGAFRIRDSSDSQTDTHGPLTVFHAKTPRSTSISDEQRWGPSLVSYIGHLQASLGLSTLDLALSMILLDRACSLDTPRSNGAESLPFCAPRTLHRLLLTSMVVAKQRTSGTSLQELYQQTKSLGISKPQMQEMISRMKEALGDLGSFVSSHQMADWEQTWSSRFPKSSEQEPPRTGATEFFEYITSPSETRTQRQPMTVRG